MLEKKYIYIFSLYSSVLLADSSIVTAVDDASLKFLANIFGSLNGLLPDAPDNLIPIGIKYFNLGIIAFVSALISYTYIMTAIKTANQGKFMGKQGGGLTALFRSVTSISVLSPIPYYNGYSLMQVMIIKIIISGVSIANSVWAETTNFAKTHGSIIQKDSNNVTTGDSTSIAYDGDNLVRKFSYCMAANGLRAANGLSSVTSQYFNANDIKKATMKKIEDGYSTFDKINKWAYETFRGKDYLNIKSASYNLLYIRDEHKKCPALKFTMPIVTEEPEAITTYVKKMVSNAQYLFSLDSDSKISSYFYAKSLKDTMTKSLLEDIRTSQADNEKSYDMPWFQSWIFAAANFNKLMGYKTEDNKSYKISTELVSNASGAAESSSQGYTPQDIEKYNLYISRFQAPAIIDPSGNDHSSEKSDIYLNAFLTVIPLGADSPLKIKNYEDLKKALASRVAADMADNRGEKTINATGSGDFGSMLSSIFLEDWDLSMLFSSSFDFMTGPNNLTIRDAIITRNIQIFMLRIYNSWRLYILKSEDRLDLDPFTRLKLFGVESMKAGTDFLANLTQDTFYASMSAQMQAQTKSMGYMIKSFAMKQAASIPFMTASIFSTIPIIGSLGYVGIAASAATINGLSTYYSMMSKVPQLIAKLLVASRLMYVALAIAAAIPPILLGLMFAMYVPFIPYLIYLFTAIGWFMTVIEAIMAAPIVAAGIANPQGHDFLGKADKIIMLLAAVFIRPICIIIGLIMAIYLFNSSVYLLDYIYFPFVEHYALNLTVNSNNLGLAIAVLLLMYVYGYLVFCLVRYSFSIIYVLPSYVVRWIGLMPVSGGEEEAMESMEGAIKEAYSSGLTGASAGINMMKK